MTTVFPAFSSASSASQSPDREQRLLALLSAESACQTGQRYEGLLRRAGLRPTRQRMALCEVLFSNGNHHVTAENLHEEAIKARIPVSLATVYNTLNQFTAAGLLRQVGVNGAKSFFDTNPSDHHHFYVEADDVLFDMPAADAVIDRIPQAPAGFEVARVEVVVRLRRKKA